MTMLGMGKWRQAMTAATFTGVHVISGRLAIVASVRTVDVWQSWWFVPQIFSAILFCI